MKRLLSTIGQGSLDALAMLLKPSVFFCSDDDLFTETE